MLRVGVPAVVCTTGLSEATQQHLTEVAKKVALFKSANMSTWASTC